MKHILTTVFLVVLLFPALALVGEVTMDDLVYWEGLDYDKYYDTPFTGDVRGTLRVNSRTV